MLSPVFHSNGSGLIRLFCQEAEATIRRNCVWVIRHMLNDIDRDLLLKA